jgi:hypothetical protein
VKRANPLTLETPDNDAGTALLLRLPGTHRTERISGAAVLMWRTWKREDFEGGVLAAVRKYPNANAAQVRADAERIYKALEAAGMIVERA